MAGDPEFRPAHPDEIREWFGAEAGSLGPVGVTNMPILADQALAGRRNMIAGANQNDYHLRHVTPGRRFPGRVRDLRQVAAGDGCAQLRRPARDPQDASRSGTSSSSATSIRSPWGCACSMPTGKEVTPIMGSYGIGIERILSCRDRAVSR